jgi:surface polysaccharide O-acyltransferase-like enzyme
LFWGAAYFAWDFLVLNKPFTAATITQGILNGPYTQFWFIYVLAGLYLLTPLLRVLIGHASKKMIEYFIVIWLLGVAIIPVFSLISPLTLNNNVFVLTGFVGYYVLGIFLLSIQVSRRDAFLFMALGGALTAIGTYVLASTIGGNNMYFFQQYLSPTVILFSTMLFLMLLKIKQPPIEKVNHSIISKIIKVISANTLGIFFVHVMILETIERGYLGFTFNGTLLTPVLEVPLMTGLVLFASLAVVVLLKKVPGLKKLIG